MTTTPGTPATLTRTGVTSAPLASLNPRLSACYQGGYASLDGSGLSDRKKVDLDKRVQEVWNRAVEVYGADGDPEFRINLTDLYIVTSAGGMQKIGCGGTPDERALIQEISDLMSLLRVCYSNIRTGSPTGGAFPRPKVENRPFQSFAQEDSRKSKSVIQQGANRIRGSNYPGSDLSKMSVEDFINGDFKTLAPSDPGERAKRESRVRKGDRLVTGFADLIRGLIHRKKVDLTTFGGSSAEAQEMKMDLASLEKLDKMIQERNSYAVYCALTLANAEAQTKDAKERFDDADAISQAVKEVLSTRSLNSESAEIIYSREVGDLVLHASIEYLQRVENDNREDPAHSRNITGASIEEFITHIILLKDLSQPVDCHAALDSLGLHFSNDLRRELVVP